MAGEPGAGLNDLLAVQLWRPAVSDETIRALALVGAEDVSDQPSVIGGDVEGGEGERRRSAGF